MRYLWVFVLVVPFLVACAPTRYVPASSNATTDEARAEFECEQIYRQHVLQAQTVRPYSSIAGFNKYSFMEDCMQAHGYAWLTS
jgi:hypothetical protein